jgi:hypothetical protein
LATGVVLVLGTGNNGRSAARHAAALPGHLDVLYAAPGDLNYAYGPSADRLALLTSGAQATATFHVTYSGFNAQAQAAFQAAVNVWATTISSPAPIRIHARFADLGADVLGQAGPTVLCSTHAGVANTWYAAALADKLTGTAFCAALAGNTYEIVAEFNSNFAWDYGTSGAGVPGYYNFMTVVLHEIGHGLGVFGGFESTGALGSNPYSPYAFIYDRFAATGAGAALLNIAQPSAALHAQLTSNNTFFNGTQARARNHGANPKLETHHFSDDYGVPSDNGWLQGSSYSHVDDVAYTGTANGLMTWALNSNEVYTDPGPLLKGLLEDLGWSIANDRPPAQATLVSPSGTITTEMPTFVWHAASGATSYDLYVGPATGGAPLINIRYAASSICTSSTCTKVSPVSFPSGNYVWWVKAWNAIGDAPWSASMAFALSSPMPTMTGPSGSSTPTVPTYTWTPVLGATYYQLWVEKAPGLPVIQHMYSAAACNGAACSVTPSVGLGLGVVHKAWVRGWSSQGFGPWSAGLPFTTGLFAPTTDLYGPRGATSNPAPTYKWRELSHATGYELWVQRAGSNPAIATVFTSWRRNGGELSVTPTTELPDGSYSWWVRPHYAWGPGLWSTPGAFDVSASVAGGATPLWPSGRFGTATPSYRWSAGTSATWYYLWMAPVGGSPIVQSWYFHVDACDSSGACQVTPNVTLTPATSYVWYVRPWNSRGDGPWSTGTTFTIANTPPGAATLVAPSGPGVSDRPTYIWNRVSDSTWYLLWVRPMGGNVRISQWYAADQICGATTCLVRPFPFLSPGPYEYYIQTYNDAGYGAWSAAMNFSRDSWDLPDPPASDGGAGQIRSPSTGRDRRHEGHSGR